MSRIEISVRPALPTDSISLAEIHVSTWRTDYRGFAPDDYLDELSVSREQRAYLEIIEGPDTAAYVAEDGTGRAVGLSTCGPYRDEGYILDGQYAGEIYNLYVIHDVRKAGVGRDLVRAAARCLLARRLTSMMLWTFDGYASNTFYPRLGGRIIGRRQALIGTRQVNDLAFGWEDTATVTGRRT